MKTYTAIDSNGKVIQYVDRKRYLWVLSVLFPLVPFIGMALAISSGAQWVLWLPLLGLYALLPLLDGLFPNDKSNPPEELSLIHISEPTRPTRASRMPSSA